MPTAVKVPGDTPWDERHDALESAIDSVQSIMGDLNGIPEFQCYYDTLEEILHDMVGDFEPLERRAQEEYDAEDAAMMREYYRSVI